MPVLERSKVTVWEQYLFKKFFYYGSFWYVSTLRKKVFSAAPVKHFFLQGSKNSDSLVFGNAGFEEIKDHSLSTVDFLKVFFTVNFFYRDLTFVKTYLVGSIGHLSLDIWCFLEYPEYPEYLFPNIKLVAACPIAPQTITPWTIAFTNCPWDNYRPDNYPQDNCPLC